MKKQHKDEVMKMINLTSKLLKIHNKLRTECPEYYSASNYSILHNRAVGVMTVLTGFHESILREDYPL